ncbi:EF-hand domain-containing protein [Psychromarinibacter halotolerans]|uniref:EF-hand domain-containing protein n=1 Tax=Psychromarinibacter halotolerans TaxID=1775175 RepID=A0ABV7GPN2_9RHOB|nr:EF-hand domain-containing protein [Psychromarinibacter halotolerans]MDF0596067.1 EF-hand domain-containing protein [Psychromarinibacter halotolerans]
MKNALITLGILAATGDTAVAMTMEQMDANGDRSVSLAEIQSVHPAVTREQFATADENSDGLLNDAELAAAQQMGLIPAGHG